jgi:hypothetical protein
MTALIGRAAAPELFDTRGQCVILNLNTYGLTKHFITLPGSDQVAAAVTSSLAMATLQID